MSKHTKPKIVGILQLIFGVSVLIYFMCLIVYGMIETAEEYGGLYTGQFNLRLAFAILVMLLPFGILSILGGIYALKRKKWGLVLAGSIAETIIVWPLGAAAIALTILSKDEFTVKSKLMNDESTLNSN